jgi:hypothetical protein
MLNIIRHPQWCTNPGPKSSGRLNFVCWRLMCVGGPSVWNLLHATFLANKVLGRLVNFGEIYAPLWLYRTFEWYISADAMKYSVSGEAGSRSDTLETLHLIWNLWVHCQQEDVSGPCYESAHTFAPSFVKSNFNIVLPFNVLHYQLNLLKLC